MTRKLHNTLMAAIASTSLLVVGLIAGSPAAPEAGAAGMLASIDAQAESAADVIEQEQAAPIKRVRTVRHRRQSLAMPFYSFYSFAPRS